MLRVPFSSAWEPPPRCEVPHNYRGETSAAAVVEVVAVAVALEVAVADLSSPSELSEAAEIVTAVVAQAMAREEVSLRAAKAPEDDLDGRSGR